MASNPQAVIEVLGFFAENFAAQDAKATKAADLNKAIDEAAKVPSQQQNVPHSQSNQKIQDLQTHQKNDVPPPPLTRPTEDSTRLSGLNDNALLDVLSLHLLNK